MELVQVTSTVFKDMKVKNLPKGIIAVCKGVAMKADEVNRNGRIYPLSLIKNRIVKSPKVTKWLSMNSLLGEPHHPKERMEVWSNEVSHIVLALELNEKEKTLYITIGILDTPNGRILKTLVDVGVVLGVSARANGEVYTDKNGNDVAVEEAYVFKTFDVVLNPGFEVARVNNISEEEIVSAQSPLYKDMIDNPNNPCLSDNEETKVISNGVEDLDNSSVVTENSSVSEGESSSENSDKQVPISQNPVLQNFSQSNSKLFEEVRSLRSENSSLESYNTELQSMCESLKEQVLVLKGELRKSKR